MKQRIVAILLPFGFAMLAGCGSGNVSPAVSTADFALDASPSVITLTSGSTPATLTVAAAAINGFTGTVSLAVTGLPSGVTATPSTLTTLPGQLQQIALTASGAPVASASFTLTGTSGTLNHTTTVPLSVAAAPAPGFTLALTPGALTVADGAAPIAVSMVATPVNGLATPVIVTPSGLPAGVSANPGTLTLTPGQPGQFMLSALGASAGTSTVVFTGTAGTLTQTATEVLTVQQGLTTASLSSLNFDFGGNLLGSTLTKPVVILINTGPAPLTLAPVLNGDPGYTLTANQTCPAMLPPGASCTPTIAYTPTVASNGNPQTATLNLGLGNVAPGTPQTIALTGQSAALPPGTVTSTNNPQVALYTMTLPFPGSVTVNFGTDTTYGHSTWSQSTATAGGQVAIFVAGMLGNTPYHMQASVQLANGLTVNDADHTFTTGAPLILPNLVATTTPGAVPQSGVEQLTFLINTSTIGVAVTDLQGNILWTYALPNAGGQLNGIEGVQLLPNGHFLLTICQNLSALSGVDLRPGVINSIREVDLAGNIVKEITATDLDAELQAAGYSVDPLIQFNHDIRQLPNGHWIVIADTVRAFTDLPGYPGVTNVLGNVVIDLDTGLNPVWVWNDFDHLDINRHPYLFPDWTHANAIVYSPSDGNLIYSLRHQNWVLKLDYQDGQGSGDILWHLGQGGDFTLVNGTDPTDWFYAQHYPSFFSQNTSGVFSLGLMDNGDDRAFPQGVTCDTAGEPFCQYSSIPVYRIDEGAMTATVTSHQILAPSLYSFFGGNTELLANGNTEYDLCGVGNDSDIFEVTPGPAFQTVWHMHATNSNAYRGYRIPSLYPGVQW